MPAASCQQSVHSAVCAQQGSTVRCVKVRMLIHKWTVQSILLIKKTFLVALPAKFRAARAMLGLAGWLLLSKRLTQPLAGSKLTRAVSHIDMSMSACNVSEACQWRSRNVREWRCVTFVLDASLQHRNWLVVLRYTQHHQPKLRQCRKLG